MPTRCFENGLTTFGVHTRERFTKLLVLEYLASSLYLLPHTHMQRIPKRVMRILLDLEGSFPETVDEYLDYLQHCELIFRDLQHLAESIDFVIEILARDNLVELQGSTPIREHEEIFTIQKFCHQRLSNVKRHLERLNRFFEGKSKALNIQESVSVKRLTVLAAVFVPLSLSASLLSMQTRFVHLHLLLYDFVGVFFILSTFALLAYPIISLALGLKYSKFLEDVSPIPAVTKRQNKNAVRLSRILSALFLYIPGLIVWSVFLASFIVGMTIETIFGLKILGYGLAVALAYVILALVTFASTCSFARTRRSVLTSWLGY